MKIDSILQGFTGGIRLESCKAHAHAPNCAYSSLWQQLNVNRNREQYLAEIQPIKIMRLIFRI